MSGELKKEVEDVLDSMDAKAAQGSISILMPQGLGLHLMQAFEEEATEEDKAHTAEAVFAQRDLFAKLAGLTDNVEAVVVLVKTTAIQPVMDEQTGEQIVKDGAPLTVKGFELDGGLSGHPDILLAMLMHLTEMVQRSKTQALAVEHGNKMEPPEGMTEEDRCPGCGTFHTPEGDAAAELLAATPGSDAVN